MSVLKNRLDLLETKLQSLIEGGAARLLPGGAFPQDLANRLVGAMRAGVENAPDGETLVPSLFVLHMHPQQAKMLSSNPVALGGLTSLIVQAGLEAGLAFRTQPVVRIYPDSALNPGIVQVRTQGANGSFSQTAAMDVSHSSEEAGSLTNSFLVVDGTRVFRLRWPVINIGRQENNHLVIDDRRVSRQHAQLRVVRGRHMIFDLDSAGGTWVNGRRIHQHLLAPGDKISLADVPLVYKQETWLHEQTQELDSSR